MGKHIRFTVHDEASWYNFGYAEIRVRYAGEPELEIETAEGEEQTVIYENVDFTALNEAMAAFEALDEADYTPDTWRAAKNFYDAAVDMLGGTFPQNAVTVGAWKLQDSIKELVPVPKAVKKTKTLKVDKGIVAAAVATVVGSAVGMTAGILKALRNRKK